jgi:hypothetical protein
VNVWRQARAKQAVKGGREFANYQQLLVHGLREGQRVLDYAMADVIVSWAEYLKYHNSQLEYIPSLFIDQTAANAFGVAVDSARNRTSCSTIAE